jgi:hypothetical protein
MDLITHIERRIAELKAANDLFCKDRWDMEKPLELRAYARELSNETTARRHELEDLLRILKPDQKKTTTTLKTTIGT